MKVQKKLIISSALTVVMVISITSTFLSSEEVSPLLITYANIATANYTDALNDAKTLKEKLKYFTNRPTIVLMENAKAAWLNARESYGQIEAFRLSNGPIDAEEGWHTSYGCSRRTIKRLAVR